MSEQTIVWDLALIQKYNYSGPRYTSYPTALEFNQGYDEAAFQRAAKRYPERPLSLYVHIPFCHKLCYFCGCNKLVTRQTHKADEYLTVLEREIIARAPLFAGRKVSQLHWGGGTPTYLDKQQISRLVAMLRQHFSMHRVHIRYPKTATKSSLISFQTNKTNVLVMQNFKYVFSLHLLLL